MTWENVSQWLLRGFKAFTTSFSFVGCWVLALFVVGAVVALFDHRHDDKQP